MSDRRRPKGLFAPNATVVAGTPKLALDRSPSTAPLGVPRQSVSASECVDVAAQADVAALAEAKRGTEPTSPGGMPNAYEALTARRAGMWETVVGVGPKRDRTVRGPLVARSSAAKGSSGTAAEPNASAPYAASSAAVPPAAVLSATPVSLDVSSSATQASAGTPPLEACGSAARRSSPVAPSEYRQRTEHREATEHAEPTQQR